MTCRHQLQRDQLQLSPWTEFMERLPNDRPSLSELRTAIASALVGLTLMVSILLGIGTHPIAAAAASADEDSVETAVAQFLVSMPGDFYAIGSVSALKNLMASGNPLVIDVRNPPEYAAGHLPGAINLPLTELEQHLEAIPHDQDVVVYCSTGYRSAMAVMALQVQGFDRVKGFPPGFAGWKAAGEAADRLTMTAQPVSFAQV